ncbi:MAG: EamA family transporter [Actinomycetota bacterium]|nr:EamA family transporter [Actinomycetota bacterium]
MNRRGIVRCALAAVLFGVSTPAASRLAERMGAFGLAGLLYLGAALAVLPFVGRVAPTRAVLRRSAGRLSIAVLFGGAIGPVLLALGLQRTPAATASLLLNLELVLTGVFAALVFAEHLGGWVISGMALVVGAGLVLGIPGEAGLRWGALLVVGACAAWAVDNSITANLADLAPVHITFVKGVVAGSVNLAIGAVLDGMPTGWPVVWALVVGGVGYGASITLWVSGARDLGAARGQLVFAGAPFVGAVVSWTVLGEDVGVRQVLAAAIAASGVALVLRSGHGHAHRHSRMLHDHEHDHDPSRVDGHHTHDHPDGFNGRHRHEHVHEPVQHAHVHVPDLHHRHRHE